MVKAFFKFIMTGVEDQDHELMIWSRMMNFMFNRCDVVEDSHIASQVYYCAWSACLFRCIGRSSNMTMLNAVMMKSRFVISKVFYSRL